MKKTWLLIGMSGVVIGLGIFFSLRGRRKMIAFSKALVGQREIAGNLGFQSDEFEQLMKEVGWKTGDAWCVYFAKLIFYQKAPEFLKRKVIDTFSGSSQTTWQRLTRDPAFITTKVPKPGDAVFWQTYTNGAGQWSGHAGIVTKVSLGGFETVEGNTNLVSGSNEGYIVAEKTRSYTWETNNGLRLKGFARFA